MTELSIKQRLEKLTPNQSKLLYYRCKYPSLTTSELAKRVGTSRAEVLYDQGHIYDKLGLVVLDEPDRELRLSTLVCSVQLGQIKDPQVDCPRLAKGAPQDDEAPSTEAMTAVLLEEQAAVKREEDRNKRQLQPMRTAAIANEPPPIIVPHVIPPWWTRVFGGWKTVVGFVGGALLMLLLAFGTQAMGLGSGSHLMENAAAGSVLVGSVTVAPATSTPLVIVVTATPLPSSPTPTPVPATSTPAPPTSTPLPPTATFTPIPDTRPGTILKPGDDWRANGILMTIDNVHLVTKDCWQDNLPVEFNIRIENTTGQSFPVAISSTTWRAETDFGKQYKISIWLSSSWCSNDWNLNLLSPGVLSPNIPFHAVIPPQDIARAKWVRIVVPEMSRIRNARWEYVVPH